MVEIKYSLVIPVFKNEKNIDRLLEVLELRCASYGRSLEVLFVVDGSPDDSLGLLVSKLKESTLRATVIDLTRNFGSFSAIRAGMESARGRYIAVMAADLQEPFSLVEAFFESMEHRGFEVAVGVRNSRGDGEIKKIQSQIFWFTYRKLVNREIPIGGVDVFGCTDNVRNQILALKESHSSLVAQLFWLGYERLEVPYDREKRIEGKSSWSLAKKLDYMFDSVFSFTDLPIRILLLVGSFASVSLFALGVFIAAARLVGVIEIPGYAALAIIILFSTATLMFSLGLVGSYSYRTFENSKARPLYLVAGRKQFNE